MSQRLALIGGGHAHAIVLRTLHDAAERGPLADARLTVVVDNPVAVYSGMVPGVVAGQYRREQVEIDVRPLASGAGAEVVIAAATRIDHAARRVVLADGRTVDYDVCSVNVGSTVFGAELPGVRDHAVPTRPIALLIDRLHVLYDELAAAGATDAPFPVVIVGGGAGGVELAFCVRERLLALGLRPAITLVHSGERVLRDRTTRLARKVMRAAARRDITIRGGTRVAAVTADGVTTESSEVVPGRLVLWVAGALAHPLARDSGLPVEARGFVQVRDTLEVEGCDGLFAAGDCAVPASWPEIPKAGVYAVREAPVLLENLRRKVAGQPLRPYQAQRDFLLLLNLGDGTALGEKLGWAFGPGRWVFRLKDRIDRAFMREHQLGPDGQPTLVN